MVPLPLFPDWMQSVIYWLPFAGLGDTPYRLYMGHIAPAAALLPLARQAATPPDTSPDPLGLKGILSSATPIIALVALMVLAPPIIEAAGSRGGK